MFNTLLLPSTILILGALALPSINKRLRPILLVGLPLLTLTLILNF